jgi:hypothetical protein
MSLLSVHYYHLDIEFNENEIEKLKDKFRQVVKNISLILYNQNVDVRIKVEQGSLKTWIAIIGTLYIAIGEYGSFRSGVDQLIEDSKIVQKVIEVAIKNSGYQEYLILENKRGYTTSDKIRRLILRLDRLENSINELSSEKVKVEIEGLINYTKTILNEVDDARDFNLILREISSRKNVNIDWSQIGLNRNIIDENNKILINVENRKLIE